MTETTASDLTTGRASALYIGALLGPSLLLLPGLAASIAGPASILAWIGLLLLSGLFALVFTALGTRIRSRGGVAAYAAAGLGPRAGRAVAWCFLAGVVLGAPVVCLIGAAYIANLFGGGHAATIAIAAVLLVAVVALTLGGARTTTTAQLALVVVLVVLVVVAVVGSAPHVQRANWTPFAPHGMSAVGSAASVLMLSFVGWEAIAPMTARLRDPGRQLPRVIAIAFGVTSVVYLALAASTIAVLGPDAGSAVPLADLLRVAIGPAGRLVAAVAAVALTLAATNAYISGATELATELASELATERAGELATELTAELPTGPTGAPSRGNRLQLTIAGMGVVLLGASALGWVSTAQLVALPTTLFLTVYLGCTAAAVRILPGRTRVAAGVACVVVAGVLAFSGWALVVALIVGLASLYRRNRLQEVTTNSDFVVDAAVPCG